MANSQQSVHTYGTVDGKSMISSSYKEVLVGSISDPDPDQIQIQEIKNDKQNTEKVYKKIPCFSKLLDALFSRLKISPKKMNKFQQ